LCARLVPTSRCRTVEVALDLFSRLPLAR
jgi:hypothetical protein